MRENLLTATPSNGKFSVSFSYPGGTKIYLRAFAENVNGITYSEQDIVIQPLKNYSQLNLSSFTALSSRPKTPTITPTNTMASKVLEASW